MPPHDGAPQAVICPQRTHPLLVYAALLPQMVGHQVGIPVYHRLRLRKIPDRIILVLVILIIVLQCLPVQVAGIRMKEQDRLIYCPAVIRVFDNSIPSLSFRFPFQTKVLPVNPVLPQI